MAQGGWEVMRMTEKEFQSILKSNKSLKCKEIKKPKTKAVTKIKDGFDSVAERDYYNNYLYPLILIKERIKSE